MKKQKVTIFIYWEIENEWRWSFYQNYVETELADWKHYKSASSAKKHAKKYVEKYMKDPIEYIYEIVGYQTQYQ